MFFPPPGLDELMSTLNRGSASTRQTLGWHSRLEELRLRELSSRSACDRWRREAERAAELAAAQEGRIEVLEQEVVRMEGQLEQRQLEWENRCVGVWVSSPWTLLRLVGDA